MPWERWIRDPSGAEKPRRRWSGLGENDLKETISFVSVLPVVMFTTGAKCGKRRVLPLLPGNVS